MNPAVRQTLLCPRTQGSGRRFGRLVVDLGYKLILVLGSQLPLGWGELEQGFRFTMVTR